MKLSDEQLILKYRETGDSNTFEELYYRYERMIIKICSSFFLLGGEFNDLLQEGWLGFLSAVNTFNAQDASFCTFAYLCVRRRIISVVQSAKGKKNKALNVGIDIETCIADTEKSVLSPEEIFIQQEIRSEYIEKIKSRLSSFENKVFDKLITGEKYREIASALGVNLKSVDNALSRIKEKAKIALNISL